MSITKGIGVSTNIQPPTASKNALVHYSQYMLLTCKLEKKRFNYTSTYNAHICMELATILVSLLN
jgi:hypothetical protein